MNEKNRYGIKFSLAALLIIIGVAVSLFVVGHNFIGYTITFAGFVILLYTWFSIEMPKHKKIIKNIRCVVTILLVLGFSYFSVVECLIIKDAFSEIDNKNEQYIVVLGAKVNGTEPSLSLANRLNTAFEYLADNPDTIAIVTGGKGDNEDISEADCMYNRLTEMGIASERIIKEDKAKNTVENIEFSKEIIENISGIGNVEIGIITSEYHIHRAKLIAEDMNIDAVGIPAKTSMPTLAVNYFIREAFALTNYYVRG